MGDRVVCLEDLGWRTHLQRAFDDANLDGGVPARVFAQERDLYVVWGERGEFTAEVTGRFRHEAAAFHDWPTVGDWVVLRLPQGEGRAAIHAVLPRQTKFSRQAAGSRTAEQIVAANVDSVFLVTGLDGDFNLRRIERYLTVAWDSGASPVVILNKADLCADVEQRLIDVEAVAPGAAVYAVSALRGDGFDVLTSYLRAGQTIALLGSSGVGKSTIINSLMGRVVQPVQSVRDSDSRGRHTTTRRELFLLEGGGLLLDTPGMRELQLWDGSDGADLAFQDIAGFATDCRYRDCAHDQEPDCAVRAAVVTGELDADRLESYHKLQREMRYNETRRDAAALAEVRKRNRAIHRTWHKFQRRNPKGEQ